MKPGDPFATEELDEQRARHRRVLRYVETWIVEDALNGQRLPPSPPQPENRPLVEVGLRSYVDELLPEHDDLLQEIAAPLEARAVQAFLAENAPEIGKSFPLEELDTRLVQLRGKYKQQVEDGEGHWLASVVLALVWADEVAGDYRDPRIEDLVGRRK